jgi:hypothetical protein
MEDELAAEVTCVAVTALLAVIVTVPFLVAYCASTSEQWDCDSRARPARQQVRDESPRPAPSPPKRLARESTRRDISMAKKEDSHPRTAGRCSASVQTTSSRTPADPASSRRVKLDVRAVAEVAPSSTRARQDPPHNMRNHQNRSSSHTMEPSSTAKSSSRRSGSTSSDMQTLQASSGAVAARRVWRSRRAYFYTRQSDLYTLPEQDSV